MPLGPGDVMVHHALAFGLHLSSLIGLKGALDARGSKLMPDKIHFGFGEKFIAKGFMSSMKSILWLREPAQFHLPFSEGFS